ncbi:hypothetical protein FQN60_007306, partial [Etheostoma spectabile]
MRLPMTSCPCQVPWCSPLWTEGLLHPLMRGRRISSPSSQWRTSPTWTGSWQMLGGGREWYDLQVVTDWGANYKENMLADLLKSVCPPASGTAKLVRKEG